MPRLDLTLVPFGLRVADNVFVDVADAPRGKASGCICPSCRSPLVARHGAKKQWHFAHATRRTYQRTQTECEFSFFVSARMMARQVVGDSLVLDLPAYRDSIDRRVSLYSRSKSIEFVVTEARSIVLTEVEVERSFNGVSVDLVGRVANFAFVIYFTHPGRELPVALLPENLADRMCGVISIELEGLADRFGKARGSETSYARILEQFLSHDVESKRWIFHPRHERAKALAARLAQAKEPDLGMAVTPLAQLSMGLAKFECVVCHVTWTDHHDGRTVCPKCKSHMYVGFRGYFE